MAFRPRPSLKAPTTDDILDAEARKVATAEVVKVLKAAMTGNPHRTIRSLTPNEGEAIAVAAISGFIKIRSEQEALRRELDDPLPSTWAA